jgi:peptidoglycan/LPS O-acetylase OafA/YrhL
MRIQRNYALDVLRGLAIIAIMLHHVAAISHSSTNIFIKTVQKILLIFYTGGWTAVDLFFVLSGFLVSGLLFKEFKQTNKINPGRFLIRRGFKIYPGYIFFILLSLFIGYLHFKYLNGDKPIYLDYVKDLFFLHNYFGGNWITTWSLDVEEAFYLFLVFFSLIIISLKKLNSRIIIFTYIALVIIGITGRITANIEYPHYDFIKQFTQTHYRLDALFFGVVLSYFLNFKETVLRQFIEKYKTAILLISLCALLPNFIYDRGSNKFVSIILLSTNPVAFGFLLIITLNSKLLIFKNNAVAALGRYSYAIYLWHPFFNLYLIEYLDPSRNQMRFLLYIFSYLLLSIMFGFIFTNIIEAPFLKIRDRYYPPSNPKTNL